MPNQIKISQLTEAANVASNDLFNISQYDAGIYTSKKITYSNVIADIIETIDLTDLESNVASLQTDVGVIEGDIVLINSALDTKANVSGQIFSGNVSALNITGFNSGDQDLAPYLTIASASNVYQPIGNYLTVETDPVFVASNAYNITANDIINIHALPTDISGKADKTTTITINGTTHDLSANSSYTINSMLYPSSGIAVSNGSAWTTSINGTSSQFVKGNGSLDNNVYLITEVDPIFTSSNAFNITANDLINIANVSGVNTGDQDLSGLVPKTYEVNGHALSGNITITKGDVGLGNVANVDTSTTSNIIDSTNKRFVTDSQLLAVSNVSGINTGDETQSTILNKLGTTSVVAGSYVNTNLTVDAYGRLISASNGSYSGLDHSTLSNLDYASAGHTGFQPYTANVSSFANDVGYLTSFTEVDPVFVASNAFNITANDILTLANTSGENTGDQVIPTNLSDLVNDENFIKLTDISGGTGISYSNVTGVITNSLPDQVISISGGTNVTISGTYPSLAITDNSINLTDISAVSPIVYNNVSGQITWTNSENYLVTEVDPVFTASNAYGITAENMVILNNTSGVNTGNQDLSGLVPKTYEVNGHALSGNITITKGDVGLGNVTNVDTSTTSNIIDSTNKRFVTDSQLANLSNVSGINTGDETTITIKTKLGAATAVADGYLTSTDFNVFYNKKSLHGIVARPVGVSNPLPTYVTTTTFTLGCLANPLTYYYMGTKVDVTTDKTTTIGGAGLYFIYFNGTTGNILNSTVFPGISFNSNIIIATVIWNGVDYGLVNDERHGYTRDTNWHIWAHSTVGVRYKSGLDFAPTGTGATSTFTLGSGEIHDEDIIFTVPASSAFPTPNALRLFWQTSATTYTFDTTPSTQPYKRGTGNRPVYINSSTYAITTLPSATNRYANYFIYTTTDLHTPLYCFAETASAASIANGYTNVANARAIPFPNLSNFGLSAELKPLFRMIVRADGLIQAIAPVDDYRNVSSLPYGAGSTSTTASAVSFVPYGNVSSTTVQTAIEEIDDTITNLIPFVGVASPPSVTLNGLLQITIGGQTYYLQLFT